jgi:hypothetical protein
MFKTIIVIGGFIALMGCSALTGPATPCSPITVCTNLILGDYTALRQFKLSLDAADQVPVVAMQPTPVIITPNPGPAPPVIVTPVVPTTGAPPIVVAPPVVGSGGPVVTPSARYRRHSHRFDDNPPASAAALNAAQLSQLTLAAACRYSASGEPTRGQYCEPF